MYDNDNDYYEYDYYLHKLNLWAIFILNNVRNNNYDTSNSSNSNSNKYSINIR